MRIPVLLALLPLPLCAQSLPEPYAEAIEAIKAVQNEGKGNEAAAEAWKQIIQGDASMVVPILEAMGDANGLASSLPRKRSSIGN